MGRNWPGRNCHRDRPRDNWSVTIGDGVSSGRDAHRHPPAARGVSASRRLHLADGGPRRGACAADTCPSRARGRATSGLGTARRPGRLRRLAGVPELSSRRVFAVEGVAPHPDDAAGRRGTVLGDFSRGAQLSATAARIAFGTARASHFVTVRAEGRVRPRPIAVDYTLGAKRLQGYLSTLPDGRMYVLPVFWHVETRRWLDWKETTPIPDGAHDMKQIWNVNCFNCHATNLRSRLRAAPRRRTAPSGPSSASAAKPATVRAEAHIALTETWARDPSLDADLQLARLESRGWRHAQDLLAAHGRPAAHVRHLRLLPRQQAERLHRASAPATATRTTRSRSW